MQKAIARTAVFGDGARADAARGLRRLSLWFDLWSERRALRQLQRHLLDDIGVAPEDAAREASRRPWDVPARRRGR